LFELHLPTAALPLYREAVSFFEVHDPEAAKQLLSVIAQWETEIAGSDPT